MRLEEVCKVFTDGDWIESKDQSKEGIRLVQTGNIGEGKYLEKGDRAKYISEETFGNLKCTEVFPGDILVSRLPEPVGRACIIPPKSERMITAVDCTICRPDESVVSKEYLCYFMQSEAYYTRLLNNVTGTTRKRISRKNLGNVELTIPDRSTQAAVVKVLDILSRIIDYRKDELLKLDQLIKARFVELFDLSKCDKVPLGECTDFVDYRGHTPELSDEGTIRMINAKSVGKGFFKYVDEYVTEETYNNWMHRGFGYPGDILFVTEGHTFGNVCLIPEELSKFALGQRVITIKGHEEIKNAFLCSYMQTDMFWKDINTYKTGGTAQGIRSKDLVKVCVPIPSIVQQEEFMSFVKQVDKSKVVVQKALDKAHLLFDSLMQEYYG